MTKILRLPEVMAKSGLGRSSIYAYVHKNAFPKPRHIGERAVGWLESDVTAWIESRTQKNGGAK